MTKQTKIELKPNSIPPPKKKRGRKRTKKRYFTEDTDLAIKQYLASSNKHQQCNPRFLPICPYRIYKYFYHEWLF